MAVVVPEGRDSYHTAAYNALLLNALEGIAGALEGAEIPAIVLKGAALIAGGVRSAAERGMSDIDLLVRSESLEDAAAVLVGLGYEEKPVSQEEKGPFRSDLTGERTYLQRFGGVPVTVELHWHLCNVEWLRRLTAIDEESLWAETRPLLLGQTKALQLAPSDMLIHLCLHLAQHNFAHQVGYQDIVSLLEHVHPFPWERFLDRVRRFRLQTVTYFPLETSMTELNARVPNTVLAKLRPAFWKRWLVHCIADPHRALHGDITYTHARSYLVHLLVADRTSDLFRLLLWLFFPGRDWLAERYQAEGLGQTFIRALLHPLRVIWEGMRAVIYVMSGRV
jgi:hypothetical protein